MNIESLRKKGLFTTTSSKEDAELIVKLIHLCSDNPQSEVLGKIKKILLKT